MSRRSLRRHISVGGVTFRSLEIRAGLASNESLDFRGGRFARAWFVPRFTTNNFTRRAYISLRDRGGNLAVCSRCSMELGANNRSTSRSCTLVTSRVEVEGSYAEKKMRPQSWATFTL